MSNPTSFRFSAQALHQLERLEQHTGKSRVHIVETALDRMYQQEMVTMPDYSYTEAAAAADINRRYHNPQAWASGIRSWHNNDPIAPDAVTYIESPHTPGMYRAVPYGTHARRST